MEWGTCGQGGTNAQVCRWGVRAGARETPGPDSHLVWWLQQASHRFSLFKMRRVCSPVTACPCPLAHGGQHSLCHRCLLRAQDRALLPGLTTAGLTSQHRHFHLTGRLCGDHEDFSVFWNVVGTDCPAEGGGFR